MQILMLVLVNSDTNMNLNILNDKSTNIHSNADTNIKCNTFILKRIGMIT